jgi:hypothetical protein
MPEQKTSFFKVTRVYILLPLAILIAFLFYYRSWEQSERAVREQERALLEVEEQQAAGKRKAMEEQMAVESQRLRELRENAQIEKERAEIEQRQKRIKELERDLATSVEQLRSTEKELADTTAALNKARSERFASEKEVFDRSGAVEKLRIEKNQTDLEYQRVNDMVLDIIVSAPMP